MKIATIRFAFLGALLMTACPAQEVVRLKIPVKEVKPTDRLGGIHVEVTHWGFIDQTGKVVVPATWDSVGNFHEGLAQVVKDDKVGYIDEAGKIISEPQWGTDDLSSGKVSDRADGDFSEGLAAVEKDKKWGYIDRTGQLVLPLHWADAGPFKEGLACVWLYHNKYQQVSGLIDAKGKVIVEPQWAKVIAFHEGLACVEETSDSGEGKKGYIDVTGKVVIKPQWKRAWEFSNGIAWVITGDYPHEQKGKIDRSGKVLSMHPWGEEPPEFRPNGLTPMKSGTDGHWGFADPTGKMVIPAQWKWIGAFSCGRAKIENDLSLTGFADESGKVVIEPVWDSAYAFEEGRCQVGKRTAQGIKYGVIDTAGKVLVPPEWNKIDLHGGYCLTRRVVNPVAGESYAWFDLTGKMIWQSEELP